VTALLASSSPTPLPFFKQPEALPVRLEGMPQGLEHAPQFLHPEALD
jgi:hypothetical protein